MHILVVLPTYNEAKNIEEVLRRTRAAVPEAEVLVVDDDSPDGTAEIATTTGDDIGRIHVLRRDRRHGFGEAYRSGFAWGMDHGADILVQMDSDLSHDPGALPQLLAALDDNDCVIGSRYIAGGSVPHWPLYRRLLSQVGNRYSAIMLGLPLHDITSGYRVWSAQMLKSIGLDTVRADGYGFQIEMTYRAELKGAHIVESPISFVDRVRGESKMSRAIIAEAILLVTRLGIRRRWATLRDHRRVTPPGSR